MPPRPLKPKRKPISNDLTLKKYHLTGKTNNQKHYIKTINQHGITFCVGPAGTGKTHIAVASAIIRLAKKQCDRIIITRPFVQAGENTGFLPGDIQQKSDPYMRPIYDELNVYCSLADIQRMLNGNQIEVLPFAYMRGRSLHNSFIIADECQNATFEQITMLLTRIGNNSTMVLTGDISQTDLEAHRSGGLEKYMRILNGVGEVGLVELTNEDIIRSPLVEVIVKAVEDYNVKEKEEAKADRDKAAD